MPETKMLINYAPGDECRVAIVEDGKLEEYYAESTENASRVNNIYVGRVMNVEPAIQAAFVDFGIGENGFLHVSDIHPMYFPGEGDETTERVGKKTPRRERPPIQECFRRGDEVTVQVLKEGVGTKGPTLTSYLSIPGRYMVMMPHMDRVGVSRKVEDEELRRRMREILDQLELPEGFGFILRTAGLDRNKTELKRDLAYLQRLWKDMVKRRKGGDKPRLLYSESDLLVRVIRDLLTNDMGQIVIDHPTALKRAARFMKIVSPRAQAKLMAYEGRQPLFHAYGIEPQVLMMHAREVPLPSGGRLVIDETEALVAIDVNSGRARGARDAETNAYRTNLEAVDEICRQLRLRDLGGIIINDLIDMRDPRKRREIEQRFKDRLKRDRARSTTLAISEFGILEMTRQRMRGSHERQHFVECHTCRGRGLLQKPISVASDGLRELSYLLAYDQIAKVEMVVSPRVAGALLSGRRKMLGRIERATGKTVEVRISESIPVDQISHAAYDAAGADIEIDRLPPLNTEPRLTPWEFDPGDLDLDEEPLAPTAEPEPEAEADEVESEPPLPGEGTEEDPAQAITPEDGLGRKKRRGRRGGRGRGKGRGEGEAQHPAAQGNAAPAGPAKSSRPHAAPPAPPARPDVEGPTPQPADVASPDAPGAAGAGPDGPRKRRRRRRRGRGRGVEGQGDGQSPGVPAGEDPGPAPAAPDHAEADDGDDSSLGADDGRADAREGALGGAPESAPDGAPGEGGKRRRRRRRGRGRGRGGAPEGGQGHAPEAGSTGPSEPRPRSGPDSPAKSPSPPAHTPPNRPTGTGDAAGAVGPGGAKPASTGELKPVRTLYAASRRKLGPADKKRLPPERP
ncbi:MAG: Rne/Rng family ribonuclease [Phycisphaerales bacterium]|nr:Rne/Rng family ribonuclease [Phycisphaerales bacterium]